MDRSRRAAGYVQIGLSIVVYVFITYVLCCLAGVMDNIQKAAAAVNDQYHADKYDNSK